MAKLSIVDRLPCHTGAFVAVSRVMHSLLHFAERVAPTNLSVLLLGETGSGKDALARHLHARSGRAGAFVAVNCAALPTSLAESELFGHVRGAFTGAERLRAGVFEQAHQGTLFLDEVGDLDLTVQVKLLRILEDGIVQRLGGSPAFAVDVRVIAATNRDLDAAVAAGRFREDLLHRISGVTLTVPPLRDRPEDIQPLIEKFLAEEGGDLRREIVPTTLAWLVRQRWPGNVRELRQAVRRAIAFGSRELLPADFAVPSLATHDSPGAAVIPFPTVRPTRTWSEIERDAITDALHRHGSIRAAAVALGRPKSTVADRARRYGLSTRRIT